MFHQDNIDLRSLIKNLSITYLYVSASGLSSIKVDKLLSVISSSGCIFIRPTYRRYVGIYNIYLYDKGSVSLFTLHVRVCAYYMLFVCLLHVICVLTTCKHTNKLSLSVAGFLQCLYTYVREIKSLPRLVLFLYFYIIAIQVKLKLISWTMQLHFPTVSLHTYYLM